MKNKDIRAQGNQAYFLIKNLWKIKISDPGTARTAQEAPEAYFLIKNWWKIVISEPGATRTAQEAPGAYFLIASGHDK